MKWWVDEVLEEVYRKGKCPVNTNDISKINEALEEAYSLIEKGWTQLACYGSNGAGARSRNDHNLDDLDDDTTLDQVNWDDPRAVCWCLEGAISLAAKRKGLSDGLEKIFLYRISASIMEADPNYGYAVPIIDAKHEVICPEDYVIDVLITCWNDMGDRTKEEVLAILEASQIQGGSNKWTD